MSPLGSSPKCSWYPFHYSLLLFSTKVEELPIFHSLSSVSHHSLGFPPSSPCSCHSKVFPSVHSAFWNAIISSRFRGNTTLLLSVLSPPHLSSLSVGTQKESVQLSRHLLMYAQIGPVLGTVCGGWRWGHGGVCACETVVWEYSWVCVWCVVV